MSYSLAILLGALQGIFEWLPVSSEGVLVLAQIHLLPEAQVSQAVALALWLHLGTFVAALVYFWEDVKSLMKSLFTSFQERSKPEPFLLFLIISTIISGLLAFLLLGLIGVLEKSGALDTSIATLIIGIILLVTAGLLFLSKRVGARREFELNLIDSLLLGVAQGVAVLPGLSRSGTTVAFLLLRRVDSYSALRASFLMSLPLTLVGSVYLLVSESVALSGPTVVSFLSAAVLGFFTIKGLMRLARRVNLAWFVLGFALLTIVAGLL